MAVTAQWVLNKVKEKIYTKANAESMVRGTSTVDRDISNITQEADGIHGVSQSVQSEEFKSHSAKMISSGEEIHGFRYADEELQVNDGSDWVTLISGKEVGGGLNPPNMKSVRVEPGEDDTQLLVYGTDPDDFELGHLKSIWGGTKVVRKVGGYPENPDDGVLVVDYQTRNQYAVEPFVDTGLVLGETYYYRWFPYSNTGVVNYNETGNRAIGTPVEQFGDANVVGVVVDLKNNLVTRLNKASNVDSDAMTINELTNKFNELSPIYKDRRKCIVADDRTILAFYGDTAYTETGKLEVSVTKNGTTYAVGSNVQVMVYQPKFYYKVTPLETEEIANGTVLRKARYEVASNPPESGNFKVHPAFKRNGVEYPYILLAAYEGTYQDADNNYDTEGTARHSTSGKYASIANSATQFQGNYSGNGREKSRTMCNNRGEGWQLLDIMSISCTQLLFLIEYATFDSQTAIGKGACPVRNLPTGVTSSLGNNSGTVRYNETTGYLVVSYRGEESLWGNTNSWIDGLIATPTEKEIYWADHDFYCEKYLVPERDPAADISKYPSYQPAGFKIPRISNWITGFGYSAACDWMFIPIEVRTEPDPSMDAYNASIRDWCFCDNEEEGYGLYRFNLPNIGGYDSFNSTSVFKKCEGTGLFNFWNHMTSTGSGTLYNARMICIPPEGAKAEY